jgi:multidrug efflux pump subunit AcrA (membrane-fusion protein)
MQWTAVYVLAVALTGQAMPDSSDVAPLPSVPAGVDRGASVTVAQLAQPRTPGGVQAADRARPARLEVAHCELTLIREVQVPARQPGVLQDLDDENGYERIEEGDMVAKGQVLGLVDDAEAKLRREAALREYEATAEQAKEDVEVQAARAAADVARAEVEDSQYVNRRSPGTVTPTEIRRQELTADRAELQIKVAEMDFNVHGFHARAAMAKVDLIDHEIEMRRIVAPFGGMVVMRHRQEGEWVQAGEPVVKLIQMDRLRVRGFLSSSDYAPYELEGRPVTITIELPGQKSHTVEGRVDYVSQVVEANREYRVWAEIENVVVEQRDNRVFWLMRPGMKATMTIDLGPPNDQGVARN